MIIIGVYLIDIIKKNLLTAQSATQALLANEQTLAKIVQASELMVKALQSGNKLISCGNGGSMCDAMHFAEELSGRFQQNRKALAAVAISDAGYISCVSNDFGYEHIFSRYIEAHGKTNDVLLAISTSGKSKNIINACIEAKKNGLIVVSLSGQPASELAKIADIDICTPANTQYADRVQELHIKVIHSIIELIEKQLFYK